MSINHQLFTTTRYKKPFLIIHSLIVGTYYDINDIFGGKRIEDYSENLI